MVCTRSSTNYIIYDLCLILPFSVFIKLGSFLLFQRLEYLSFFFLNSNFIYGLVNLAWNIDLFLSHDL